MPYKHIICVVDGSKESERAQEGAAELALNDKSKLTYIFLADTGFLDKMSALARGGRSLDTGMENIGNLLLDRAQEIARAKGVESEREILTGGEAESLEKEMSRLGVDLLVTHLEQGSFLLDIDRNDLESRLAEVKEKTGVEVMVY